MRTPSKKRVAMAWGLALIVVSTGCQQQNPNPQSSANVPHIILATPQQRQSDIESNAHIPMAQKAAINAQLAREAQLKVQPTPSH